jgi:hemolysin III
MKIGRIQNPREEFYNTITHVLGIAFCLIGMPFLLYSSYQKVDIALFISVFIFGFGMLLVYTFSSLYYAAKTERAKDLLQIGDHISIYFLIAGTYTPLMVRYLKPETAMLFLGVMWTIVVIGVVFKLFFTKRFKLLSVLLYLALGWMIVFVIEPLSVTMPFVVFKWILIGGASYSIGVYFYVKDTKTYFHSIWHLFVLLGTVAHFVAVYISLK